jgi:hypothetical protein
MPSTARAAETTMYDSVWSHLFTQIHGCPSRGDYKILKQEASSLASEVDTITNDEYGLLAKIIDSAEYEHQTSINTYTEETEPAAYDHTIINLTPTHMRKCLEEE